MSYYTVRIDSNGLLWYSLAPDMSTCCGYVHYRQLYYYCSIGERRGKILWRSVSLSKGYWHRCPRSGGTYISLLDCSCSCACRYIRHMAVVLRTVQSTPYILHVDPDVCRARPPFLSFKTYRQKPRSPTEGNRSCHKVDKHIRATSTRFGWETC